MFRFTVFALAAALLFIRPVVAQQACELSIHVRTPDDREYNGHVQVELLSSAGTPVATTQTSNGSADFQVASGVTYRARISGQGIEPINQDFFIMGGAQVHTENINVKLASSAAQQESTASFPMVSLTEMNAPSKARDEMQKGMEAVAKGDFGKAEQHFEKATAVYPQYARAYVGQGLVAIKTGDRAKAKDRFSKAIEVDDKFVPAYVDLARIEFQEKNYSETESLLKKVMALNPSMPDAVALLASTEYINKEYDSALADAQRVHSLPNHEQFAEVHLLAGEILEMRNQPQRAIVEYELFLKESPKSPQAAMVQRELSQLRTETH
jgi:tetratricopeptide (TPR) repeat protein